MNPAAVAATNRNKEGPMSVTIYGASDDLIEVEGDINAEFNAPYPADGGWLALSSGDVFEIAYSANDDGCWRITPFAANPHTYTKVEAISEDDDNYSDRVTVEGSIRWVVFGGAVARARP